MKIKYSPCKTNFDTQIKYIDENTYIREFTIERTYLSVLKDNLTGDWQEIKNFFDPNAKPIESPKKPGKKPAKR